MKSEDMQTYVNGYRLKALRDITTHDFVKLCQLLKEQFANHDSKVDHSFVPERITEGGILFIKYPGKSSGAYKSMRLRATMQEKGYDVVRTVKWPMIQTDQLAIWSGEAEVKTLYPKGTQIQTFLKAFYEVPAWTRAELRIFEACFNEIGLKRVGAYPKLSLK